LKEGVNMNDVKKAITEELSIIMGEILDSEKEQTPRETAHLNGRRKALQDLADRLGLNRTLIMEDALILRKGRINT
jgi:predicted RNA-binding protein